MNATTEFFNQISKFVRTANGRSRIYAERARQEIVDVYQMKDGEMVKRFKADTTKADKLVEMGFSAAVYGKGRFLLDK